MRRKKRTFRRSGRFWEVRHEAGTDHSRVARQRDLPPLRERRRAGRIHDSVLPVPQGRLCGFRGSPALRRQDVGSRTSARKRAGVSAGVLEGRFRPALARLFPLESVADWQSTRCSTGRPLLSGERLAADPGNTRLLGRMLDSGKVVGAVSYGPAALLGGTRCDGHPLVFRRGVTGLSNAEEDANPEDSSSVRFRLEDRLKSAGAIT